MTDENRSFGGNKNIFANTLVVGGDFVVQSDGSDISTKTEALKRLEEGIPPRHGLIEEHKVFKAAREQAVAMCEAGRHRDASRVFVAAFEQQENLENQRREAHQRLCLALLEEAVSYDKKARNYEDAVAALFRIAKLFHPADCNARGEYLLYRSSKYEEQGEQDGDNVALSLSARISRKVASDNIKGKIDDG
jgi:hypothetical protein